MREEREILLSQRDFWNQVKKKKKREREKEREPEKARENGAPGMFWRRKKRKIKEGGRDGGHVCGREKQEKKKGKMNETYGWEWNEERKNNIKNKKS